MAFDEGSSIHELLIMPIRGLIGENLPGFLLFTWIIPGIVIILVVAFFYLRFILSLPKQTKVMILISGFIYLGGLIGMEMLGGNYANLKGIHNLPYNIFVTIEESLEMTGLVLFIYALLDYLEKNYSQFYLKFKS